MKCPKDDTEMKAIGKDDVLKETVWQCPKCKVEGIEHWTKKGKGILGISEG